MNLPKTKVLWLSIAFVVASAVLAQDTRNSNDVRKGSLAYLDARNGFRDVGFGSPRSTLKGASPSGFLLVTTDFFYQPLLIGPPAKFYKDEIREWLECYERPGDSTTIGQGDSGDDGTIDTFRIRFVDGVQGRDPS